MLLFHAACGGIEADDFAPYLLPNGESIEWRIKPLSATQIDRIDLYMREGRRTIDVRPDGSIAILPFLRCFGPKIPRCRCLARRRFSVLRDPRIQRQAVKH